MWCYGDEYSFSAGDKQGGIMNRDFTTKKSAGFMKCCAAKGEGLFAFFGGGGGDKLDNLKSTEVDE